MSHPSLLSLRVYFITTPGYWRQDDTNQVCVHVSESSSPEGSLLVQLIPKEWSKNVSEPIADFTFSVPAGEVLSSFSKAGGLSGCCR